MRLFNRILNFYLHSLFRFSLYFFIFFSFRLFNRLPFDFTLIYSPPDRIFRFFIMVLFDFELGQIRFCAKLIYSWKQNIPSVRCLCHFDQSPRLRIVFVRSFYINASLLVRTVLIISFNRSMPFTWQKALKWSHNKQKGIKIKTQIITWLNALEPMSRLDFLAFH